MTIVGMNACGKTHCLLEILEKRHKGRFDYTTFICPAFSWNKTYEWNYVNNKHFITLLCGQDQVEGLLSVATDLLNGTSSLIILDDCASSMEVKNGASNLVKFGFSVRHYALSNIVVTQQLTCTAKPYRDNVRTLVVFHNPNKRDLTTVMKLCW